MKLTTSEKIRLLVTRKKMTVKEFGEAMGWTRQWASCRLNGQGDWKLGELRKVAGILGAELDELIGDGA